MIDSKNGVIGLAGIYYGLEDVNENWKSNLQKFDYIVKLCERFNNVLNEIK